MEHLHSIIDQSRNKDRVCFLCLTEPLSLKSSPEATPPLSFFVLHSYDPSLYKSLHRWPLGKTHHGFPKSPLLHRSHNKNDYININININIKHGHRWSYSYASPASLPPSHCQKDLPAALCSHKTLSPKREEDD